MKNYVFIDLSEHENSTKVLPTSGFLDEGYIFVSGW